MDAWDKNLLTFSSLLGELGFSGIGSGSEVSSSNPGNILDLVKGSGTVAVLPGSTACSSAGLYH